MDVFIADSERDRQGTSGWRAPLPLWRRGTEPEGRGGELRRGRPRGGCGGGGGGGGGEFAELCELRRGLYVRGVGMPFVARPKRRVPLASLSVTAAAGSPSGPQTLKVRVPPLACRLLDQAQGCAVGGNSSHLYAT